MATDAAKSTSVESIEKGAISLSPIRRNSVLEEFRASRFADIQEEICSKTTCSELCWTEKLPGEKRGRVECHQHKDGDLQKEVNSVCSEGWCA